MEPSPSCYRKKKLLLLNMSYYIPGVSVHDFPNPDKFPQHYRHWVEIVGKPLEKLTCYEIYRKKKICSIHFTEKDWNRNNRLNALAVPSLYLPGITIYIHIKINYYFPISLMH